MFLRVGKEDIKVSLKDTGTLLLFAGMSFFVPIIMSILIDKSPENLIAYSISALGLFATGYIFRHLIQTHKETEIKHAMLSTVLIWIIYTFFASLPFVFILRVGFIHAFFETMSTLTTTGLSVFIPLIDIMPPSLIFWRSFLGWIGGIGIVLLALIGIMTTYSKFSKLMIAEGRGDQLNQNLKTATKKIAIIYIILTIIGIVLLMLSGQNLWQATNYSMSAISTNGMDITTSGLAGTNNGFIPVGVNNYFVNISLIIIMVLGATSFTLHYLVIRKKNFLAYFKDPEFRLLILLGLIGTLFTINKLGLMTSFYHIFSSIACGGPSIVLSSEIINWDSFVKLIIIILLVIGGAAGSTAGGIKISRFIIFVKGIYWKIKSTILPEGSYFKKQYNGQNISDNTIKEISQFILLWISFLLIGTMVLTSYGNSFENSLFEVASAQSNAGISTGITNYNMPLGVEIILILNMFIGRLEIIPIMASIGLLMNLRNKRK